MAAIYHGGLKYAGGGGSGGTTVIPNPQGPATADLEKLQIESTVYGLPQVSASPILTSGVPIATLTLNGQNVTLYAPAGGGGDEVSVIERFIEFKDIIHDTRMEPEGEFKNVRNPYLIPLMTSNTAPKGVASCSSYYNSNTNYDAFRAFNYISCNADCTLSWLPTAADSAPYLQYTWDTTKTLSKIYIETYNNSTAATRTAYIEGSVDGTTWENCLASGASVSLDFPYKDWGVYFFDLNQEDYLAIRIRGTEPWYMGANQTACCISEVQVY